MICTGFIDDTLPPAALPIDREHGDALKKMLGLKRLGRSVRYAVDAMLTGHDLILTAADSDKYPALVGARLLDPAFGLQVHIVLSGFTSGHDEWIKSILGDQPFEALDDQLKNDRLKSILGLIRDGSVQILLLSTDMLEDEEVTDALNAAGVRSVLIHGKIDGEGRLGSASEISGFIDRLEHRPQITLCPCSVGSFNAQYIFTSLDLNMPIVFEDPVSPDNMVHDVIKVSGISRHGSHAAVLRTECDTLLRLVRPASEAGKRVVIFCNTFRDVDSVCDYLQHNGLAAGIIHGSTPPEMRDLILNVFRLEDPPLLVATNAFIRKAAEIGGVHLVIHIGLPVSLNIYDTRCACASGDPDPRSYILWSEQDWEFMSRLATRDPVAIYKLNAVAPHIFSQTCYRQTLNRYFGHLPGAPCGCCRACLEEAAMLSDASDA